MWDRKLSNEAHDCDAVAANDPWGTLLSQVRTPSPDECDDGGEDVDGNRKELSVCARVAETVDDSGDCGGETVFILASQLSYRWKHDTHP